MSKLSLCILDDRIPIQDLTDINVDFEECIDINILKHCLARIETWSDPDLQSFITAIKDEDNYQIFGFIHHSFFFAYKERKNILFSPDIIIFDWDMQHPEGTDSSKNLLKLLKTTYCLIAIFTGADNDHEIDNELGKNEFKEFKSRIFKIRKDKPDSTELLKSEIATRKNHFSFTYGNQLKILTEKALSEILSNIGRLSYDEFVCLFGEKETENQVIKSKLSELDFIEIICDKLKSALINSSSSEVIKVTHRNINDEQHIKKIWRYRLYQKPKDSFVRKGDIIKKEGSSLLYLVLSSDCHLNKFWQKNLGYLTLIPIYPINDDSIKNKLNNYNNENISKFKITSLTNPLFLQSFTVLPGIFSYTDVNHEITYDDGLLIPKEIMNLYIEKNDTTNSNGSLIYDNGKIIGTDRLRLSEPFLSPIIQFTLKTVTDAGVPDFGIELQEIIKTKIRSLKNETNA
jgi:hypothetical protein